jgi:hypothetical protein
MTRPRPLTEMYLSAVRDAVARPGVWVDIPREFVSEANVSVTAKCLERGFLRVVPRADDTSIAIDGKRFIATDAPVRTRVTCIDGGWLLSVRHESTA